MAQAHPQPYEKSEEPNPMSFNKNIAEIQVRLAIEAELERLHQQSVRSLAK